MGEQSFLCVTHQHDLIHIPKKLHEDIPNGYRVMSLKRILKKNNQRPLTWKLRKREQSFLCATQHPDPIHIPIKLHEDILNCY